MDAVTGLCDASDVGIKTLFNQGTGAFTVKLYHGEFSQAVFSKEYENLTEQVYTESEIDYATLHLSVARVKVPSGHLLPLQVALEKPAVKSSWMPKTCEQKILELAILMHCLFVVKVN